MITQNNITSFHHFTGDAILYTGTNRQEVIDFFQKAGVPLRFWTDSPDLTMGALYLYCNYWRSRRVVAVLPGFFVFLVRDDTPFYTWLSPSSDLVRECEEIEDIKQKQRNTRNMNNNQITLRLQLKDITRRMSNASTEEEREYLFNLKRDLLNTLEDE